MALGRQHTVGRHQNSVSFRANDKRLGPVSNTILVIVLACLLGLLYLTQVTKTNAYGYTINALERERSSLQTQQDDLSVTAARLQSVDRVQASAEAKNLVATKPSGTIQ